MFIERLQVEEGFLDGLDLSLVGGLNVIIGARGTGKTSVIELIRFCLGVKGFSGESTKKTTEHAISVLGSGQVTVTLNDDGRTITVTRASADPEARSTSAFTRPIIFSQTEIETVGLQAASRLTLVDSFAAHGNRTSATEQSIIDEIRSVTVEIELMKSEIEELEAQLKMLPEIEQQIALLLPSEQSLTKISTEASAKKAQLDSLSATTAQLSVADGFIERYQKAAARWRENLQASIAAAPKRETWPIPSLRDPIAAERSRIAKLVTQLTALTEELALAVGEIDRVFAKQREERVTYDNVARDLRKQIDSLQHGAGSIARQGQTLRERKAQLQSLSGLLKERRGALKTSLKKRSTALESLDDVREKRFHRRLTTVKDLNEHLGPRIKLEIERAGQYDSYTSAISEVLRGSGLRYNELADTIARRLSPAELLEAVDKSDYDVFVELVGLSKDRATRVISQLKSSSLGNLATCLVEDSVNFCLLDGSDYKDFADLSTGQRCTVVLPIILEHSDRILIVDQPEDHIDNAFIVDTLIKAIVRRANNNQVILTTHNANIPVLGDAMRVCQLGSDGKRGFVVVADSLESPDVVGAVSGVMEGGAEAFQKRALFYNTYLSS